MTTTLSLPWIATHRRRHSGAPGAPADLRTGEIASNESDVGGLTLWLGVGDNGSGLATSAVPIANPPPARISDANHAALFTDGGACFVALTASRVLTLPPLAAVPKLRPFLVMDESGNASPTCTITIQPAGSDLLNGISAGQPGGSLLIETAFQLVILRPGFTTWTLG